MAVGFDESGDSLVRTAGLPNCNAAYTVCAWVKPTALSGSNRVFLFGTSANSTSDVVDFSAIPRIRRLVSNGSVANFGADPPAVGTWYFIGMRRDSASSHVGFEGASYSDDSATNVSGRTATNQIAVAEGTGVAMVVAAIKLWTAALTNDEIAAEMLTVVPQRTADLYGWWPLETHTDLADYSGNGRHWTGNGTLSTEAGPVIPWDLSTGGGTLTPTTWENKWALESLTM